MPGAPPRASTSMPESSAIAGRPERRAAWRALMMAFSTKLWPSSTASGMANSPCGTSSTSRSRRMACSSASFLRLPLASTTFTVLTRVQRRGPLQQATPFSALRLQLDAETQQLGIGELKLADVVDGVALAHFAEVDQAALLHEIAAAAAEGGSDRRGAAIRIPVQHRDVQEGI